MSRPAEPSAPPHGSGRLAGRVAVVLGAGCVGPGWGNGRATAVRFVEEGAHVFAVDLDQGRCAAAKIVLKP